MKVRVEKEIGGKTFSIETGELAKQAAGSCLVQYGDTVVLCATATGSPRMGIDFFPLTCDYRERVAAAGKFPGGFLKREGRPTMKETLTARLIDRPIRPLFPEWFRDEVQCQAFVMASDRQVDGDVLAMNGSSAALCLSPMPFLGPIASVRMGYIDGPVRPLPHARRPGIQRPGPDRLGQQGSDPHDRGLRPRNDRGRDGRRDRWPPTKSSSRSATCSSNLVEKAGVKKPEYDVPEPDGLLDTLKEKYYDALNEAKRTEGKAARSEACDAVKQRAIAEEMIPDPEAEGAIELGRLQVGLARPRRGR